MATRAKDSETDSEGKQTHRDASDKTLPWFLKNHQNLNNSRTLVKWGPSTQDSCCVQPAKTIISCSEWQAQSLTQRISRRDADRQKGYDFQATYDNRSHTGVLSESYSKPDKMT